GTILHRESLYRIRLHSRHSRPQSSLSDTMVTVKCVIRCMLPDDLLFRHRRAEHIMAMPATQRRWTAHEVRQLIAESPLQTPRYELVDGELLVTPSPSFAHQRAVALLLQALHEYLQSTGIGLAITSPFDVELEP